jgi:hypothetical protein
MRLCTAGTVSIFGRDIRALSANDVAHGVHSAADAYKRYGDRVDVQAADTDARELDDRHHRPLAGAIYRWRPGVTSSALPRYRRAAR